MAQEIGKEYASSLADLTVNSKPLINMLTILAEENQEHAGVIVNAVETHLEKVRPDVKLPVLYLVDSIVKNVGGAYTQKFSQIIVNMFTKTFKQVDEKTRSQMFKLRETWNEVFPTNKLYQLDVKVNLVDPAWPIQAQIPLHSPAANLGSAVAPVIHLNPHFQKKGVATVAPTSTVAATSPEKEEDMVNVLARKQQELLLLQRHKLELQLEATRRQLTQNNTLPNQGLPPGVEVPAALLPGAAPESVPPAIAKLPIQQRLGPPVLTRTGATATARIAPISGVMLAGTRRADPRLARHHHVAPAPATSFPTASVAPDVFDIKPLERTERGNKRKNAITIDVRHNAPKPDEPKPREPRAQRDPRARLLDPRLKRRQREPERRNDEEKSERTDRNSEPKLHTKKFSIPKMAHAIFPIDDPKRINKLPPIPRISRAKPPSPVPMKPIDETVHVQIPSPSKRRREAPNSPHLKKPKKKEGKDSPGSSPEKSSRNGPRESKKTRELKPPPVAPEPEAELPSPERPAPERPAPVQTATEQSAPERPAPERLVPEWPSPDRSAPERPAAERPAPERSAPERSAPERSAPERSVPERSAPERSAPERSAPERSALERPVPEWSAPERSAPERSAPERSAPERSAPEQPAPDRPAPEPPAPEDPALEPESKNESEDEEAVAFKELRNSARERNYMRRNREKSESPERGRAVPVVPERPSLETEAPTVPDILMDENKDVDLRVFQNPALEPAPITRKRPSTEAEVAKPVKKTKMEKFDILFGNEDVDLRKLPQMEEAPPPPSMQKEVSPTREVLESPDSPDSPRDRSWAKMKDPKTKSPDESRSQLDLVRAKLAEATKGKDRLGRPLLYNKDDPTALRRRTISSSEDTDMRYAAADNDSENDREAIKIIMSQAEEQLKGGNLNPEQFNLLVMQVLQLNERQKLKEAKQRESLEVSKRKLQKLSSMTSDDETDAPKKASHDAVTSFGDIDERVLPLRERPPKPLSEHNIPPSQNNVPKDSDLRVPPIVQQFNDFNDGANHPPYPPTHQSRPLLPVPPMFHNNNFPPMWVDPRPRDESNGPRIRGRGISQPFFRGRMPFDMSRPPFDLRMPMPPPPIIGISQGECPIEPYVRSLSPPLLGTTDIEIPPTDYAIIDYIDRDPMKTIDIDGVAREIRFYDRTAIVMMDWDDPREITFLPGRRRITFDGKESFSLNFNEDDVRINVNGQLLKVGYGKPTRELYVEDKWYECFFGGPPCGIIVDGKVFVVHLSGPPPQVDIGKTKRTDIVAGKINVVVDAVTMSPVFLDAKPQKFEIDGVPLAIRFVDSLQTVLINEKPFKVEYGGLPKPIIVNNNKHFIRFSMCPGNIKAGRVTIANMEGRPGRLTIEPVLPTPNVQEENSNQTVENNVDLNAEGENSNPAGGLDMLASMARMPSSMAPASQFSGYSVAEPLNPTNPGQIPGLDTPKEETPTSTTGGVPFFGSINVNDLFAKLVSTGILPQNQKTEKTEPPSEEKKSEDVPVPSAPKQITPEKPKQDKKITRVDLLRPETLRVKQGGIVSLLYSGMQCSGCGARYPPEQTVIYSQHLDWHFRQNRRERDSARRAHSRNWHYDLSDWIQYEEVEDLEEREKSWFESQGTTGDPEGGGGGEGGTGPGAASADDAQSVAAGAPADAACALCGDKFDQFYNQDKEEWHLRKAVRHDNNNYHPLCFEDYKASLAKAEAPIDDSVIEVPMEDQSKPEAGGADDENSKDPDIEEVIGSDNESVVEVIESESQEEVVSQDEEPTSQATVVDEDDDDDVVLKAEPVVQVDVEDDADTDDETTAARAERDNLFHINSVRIKQEPIDPDDEPVVTLEAEPERTHAHVDTTHAGVTSSIDGNVQLETAAGGQLVLPSGGIRINITKPAAPPASPPSEDSHTAEDCEEPLPPGEEPQIEYTIKPTLRDVEFGRQPPVQRGTELSGLCSIM